MQNTNTGSKHILFYHYTTFTFLYMVANGIVIEPGSFLTMLIPAIFITYGVWANLSYNTYYNNFKSIYVYILYMLVLVPFSSDIIYSFKNVLKSLLPLLYFGIAVSLIREYKDLNRLFKSFIILSMLYVINLLISNVFNLGGGAYTEDEEKYLQMGSIYSEGLNSMAYYLILLPAIIKIYPFKSKFQKFIYIAIAASVLISLIVVLKRGTILVVVIGYIILLLSSSLKFKRTLIQLMVVSVVIIIAAYPLYSEILQSRVFVRENSLRIDNLKFEARYLENVYVIEDILFSGRMDWLLFGHDILNSVSNYGGGVYGDRQLHNDYAQLLNGSGVIGLFLYFMMNISIYMYFIKIKKRLIKIREYSTKERFLNAIFLSIFFSYFFLSLSGSITSTLFNVIRFIILGAIIGIYSGSLTNNKMVVHENNNM